MKTKSGFFKKNTGDKGERIAEKYIKHKGYRILERNYRTEAGEIDIIALDGNEVVFVEVKTRTDTKYAFPEETVDRKKVRRIAASGEIFLRAKGLLGKRRRIDVIAVEPVEGKLKVAVHIVGI